MMPLAPASPLSRQFLDFLSINSHGQHCTGWQGDRRLSAPRLKGGQVALPSVEIPFGCLERRTSQINLHDILRPCPPKWHSVDISETGDNGPNPLQSIDYLSRSDNTDLDTRSLYVRLPAL
jgi:hypothetical protein